MVSPKRIFYVNHTGKVSGAEKVLLNMLTGLNRERFTPFVLCGSDGSLAATVREMGVECIAVRPLQARFTARPDKLLKYLGSIVKSVFEMRNHIRKVQPDLLHCNTVRAGIVVTVATVGMQIPVIWHVHDILPEHFITSIIRYLAYHSNRVTALCVSKATAQAFAGVLDFGDRVQVLHNGVDLSRFPKKTASDQAFRAALGAPPDALLFCTVGQIAPRKNLEGLLAAFAIVSKVYDKARLILVGDAIFNEDFRYRDKLGLLVNELDLKHCVQFLGTRKDVSEIMRCCDALILNSIEEPFGLVLVEAMSSGIAVIASLVGGIPEIVTDRCTGFLVPSNDSSALASAMLEVIEKPDLRRVVEQEAILKVCPKYSASNFLDKLHVYYASIHYSHHHSKDVAEAKTYS